MRQWRMADNGATHNARALSRPQRQTYAAACIHGFEEARTRLLALLLRLLLDVMRDMLTVLVAVVSDTCILRLLAWHSTK